LKIFKIDKNGNSIWGISNIAKIVYVKELPDSSLLLIAGSGINKEDNYYDNNAIIKLNADGEFQWRKEFINYRLNSINNVSEGGFIAGGSYRIGSDFYDLDAGILKLDRDFNCDVDTVGIINNDFNITNYELANYPNPFNNSTVISYNLAKTGNIDLSIYNAKGELVKQLVNARQGKGWHSTDFNANGLNSGVYFVKLSGEKMNVNKKILLIK